MSNNHSAAEIERISFKLGDPCMLLVNAGVRSSLDPRRVEGKVIAITDRGHYQNLTKWGILDRYVPMASIYPVSIHHGMVSGAVSSVFREISINGVSWEHELDQWQLGIEIQSQERS